MQIVIGNVLSATELADIRAVLEVVAREFKVAGEEKIARSIAISAS